MFITDGILSQFNCNKFWLFEIVISTLCWMSLFYYNNRATNSWEQAEKFSLLAFSSAALWKFVWKRIWKSKVRENPGVQGDSWSFLRWVTLFTKANDNSPKIHAENLRMSPPCEEALANDRSRFALWRGKMLEETEPLRKGEPNFRLIPPRFSSQN